MTRSPRVALWSGEEWGVGEDMGEPPPPSGPDWSRSSSKGSFFTRGRGVAVQPWVVWWVK